MNKFLLLCVIFLFCSIGIVFFTNIDYVAFLKVGDYILESSVFTLIGLLILTIITLIIFLKIIFLICDLPYLIKDKWRARREQKIQSSIIQSAIYLLMQEKDQAYQLIKKLQTNDPAIKGQYKELFIIVMAETTGELDKQMSYYKSLTEHEQYRPFAFKTLAKILHRQGAYAQSLEYANKALKIDSTDVEILEILLHCYLQISIDPESLKNIAETEVKLKKLAPEKLYSIQNDIVKIYIVGSKKMLEKGDNKQAERYIKAALELKPNCIEAIDLYVAINVNSGKSGEILEMIETAFQDNPSFELAEIYAKVAGLPAEELYNKLASLTDASDHVSVFLALSAYLNVPNKIKDFSRGT